jgi:hypothetical protein
MLLLVFLCCYNSFRMLMLHVLLPCMLLFHTLLFSHIVLLTCCYFVQYSFHVLLFSRIVFLTHNSKYLLAHQVVALLALIPLFFLHCCALVSFISIYGTSLPLFAMCKLKIKGWSSHAKGKLFFQKKSFFFIFLVFEFVFRSFLVVFYYCANLLIPFLCCSFLQDFFNFIINPRLFPPYLFFVNAKEVD